MAILSVLAEKLGVANVARKGTLFGDFYVDATLSEKYKLETEITDNPVEEGALVSDSMILKPIGVDFHCIVSNTPIDLESSLRGGAAAVGAIAGRSLGQAVGFGSGQSGGGLGAAAGAIAGGAIASGVLGLFASSVSRKETALLQFEGLIQTKTKFTIQSGLKKYDNMVVASLEVNRDGKTGDVLDFTVACREIVTVESAEVTVPKSIRDVIHSAGKKADLGKQSKKELDNKSVAATLFDKTYGRTE